MSPHNQPPKDPVQVWVPLTAFQTGQGRPTVCPRHGLPMSHVIQIGPGQVPQPGWGWLPWGAAGIIGVLVVCFVHLGRLAMGSNLVVQGFPNCDTCRSARFIYALGGGAIFMAASEPFIAGLLLTFGGLLADMFLPAFIAGIVLLVVSGLLIGLGGLLMLLGVSTLLAGARLSADGLHLGFSRAHPEFVRQAAMAWPGQFRR